MTVYSFREQADMMTALLWYYSLHNNPEERSSQLLRGESLKSCWRTWFFRVGELMMVVAMLRGSTRKHSRTANGHIINLCRNLSSIWRDWNSNAYYCGWRKVHRKWRSVSENVMLRTQVSVRDTWSQRSLLVVEAFGEYSKNGCCALYIYEVSFV
jgi:hypothetical protein